MTVLEAITAQLALLPLSRVLRGLSRTLRHWTLKMAAVFVRWAMHARSVHPFLSAVLQADTAPHRVKRAVSAPALAARATIVLKAA